MKKVEAEQQLRDRIKGHALVKAKDILPCPWNWRTHTEEQKSVLNALLEKIGIAKSLLVREVKDGKKTKYELIDGHLRREEYPPEQEVPVEILDVTEEEAYELLCTLDPSTALAGSDRKMLRKLLKKFKTDNDSLIGLFSELVDSDDTSGLDLDVEGEADTTEIPEDVQNIPESMVRMVQLFLNVETFPQFEKMVEFLQGEYLTDNPTDTVMKALKREYKNCKKKAETAVA